ncbi:MAG TPA: hypothetical protein VHE30_21270 [Polyangiaceae bacterium]|nr:hypothetical protein [Polyangiaceae bacterium]
MTSKRHVAVWMDHHEAHVFHVDVAQPDDKIIQAPAHRVHRHPKGATAEHNHPEELHHFFKEVSSDLQGAERVLVVGPGTAKLQFIRYAHEHDPSLDPRIVGVETVDHPTDGQLVAYARRYFAADDRMQAKR